MQPTLQPGDRLRIDPAAYRRVPPHEGDLVVLIDPQAPGRWLVKRVASVRLDSPIEEHAVRLTVLSDNPLSARDSRQFGDVALSDVVGRVYRRYAPDSRRRDF